MRDAKGASSRAGRVPQDGSSSENGNPTPITQFIDAVRLLTLAIRGGSPTAPTDHPLLVVGRWLVVIMVVLARLAVGATGRKT
jgi:hypothetical protein